MITSKDDNEYRLKQFRNDNNVYKAYITDYDIIRVLDLLTCGRIYRDSELRDILRYLCMIKSM